jgi:hypothetical protein
MLLDPQAHATLVTQHRYAQEPIHRPVSLELVTRHEKGIVMIGIIIWLIGDAALAEVAEDVEQD